MHRLSSSTVACHFLYGTTFATAFIINSTCMSSEWSRHNCYCLWSWAKGKLYFLFIYWRSLYPEIRVIRIFHICENKYANHFVLHFTCTKGHSWVVRDSAQRQGILTEVCHDFSQSHHANAGIVH
jgi:hypothetical protein